MDAGRVFGTTRAMGFAFLLFRRQLTQKSLEQFGSFFYNTGACKAYQCFRFSNV